MLPEYIFGADHEAVQTVNLSCILLVNFCISCLLSDSINYSCTLLKITVSFLTMHHVNKRSIIQCITIILPSQPVTIFDHMQIITMWTLGRIDAMHKNFSIMLALFLMLTSAYYAQNYVGIIGAGLTYIHTYVRTLHTYIHTYIHTHIHT